MKPFISLDDVRRNLTGPVASVRPSFHRDGTIDYNGIRRYIDFIIEAGSRTMLLTPGDSLFRLLTDQEIAEFTRITVEHTAGRAMVVAAEKSWWTGKAVEFARYARDIGADVCMVSPPDNGESCTVQSFVEHYAAVAREIPVMVVAWVFIPRGMNTALDVSRALLHQVENIVAFKDDFVGEFGRKLSLMAYDRWSIFAGGLKQNHMNIHPYGCDGYLSTFITFKPSIAHEYWKAIEENDKSRAIAIIRDYDMPFFDFIFTFPGGFDACIHGCYELFGITGRWRRRPFYTLNDGEMERLADFLKKKNIL